MALAPGDTDDCVFGETIPTTNHRYRYKKVAFPHPLPTLPMSREAAFKYMVLCMCCDLRMRVADARTATFTSRMHAFALLTNSFRSAPLSVAAWHRASEVVLEPRQWSEKQHEFLTCVADHTCVRDASEMAIGLKRFSHITGGPGTGNTEVIINAAYRAAEDGARVLILCPTGALVHGYRERLPPTDLAAKGKALIYPNVFITVIANECDFPFHSSISARFKGKQMTDCQGPMTLDIYRVLTHGDYARVAG